MNKLKKIFKTVLIFLTMIILICFLTALIKVLTHQLPLDKLIEETGTYFLYTIGYGSLDHDTVIQQVFAMVGIISLSLMGTFLTINLFWRIDDVKIKPTILWQKDDQTSKLYFEVENKGQSICDLKATFMTYDKDGNLIADNLKDYTYPLLVHNAKWTIAMDINETYWYQTLKNILNNDEVSLYMTFSLVDVKTGQSSIKVVSWQKQNIVANDLVKLINDFKEPNINYDLNNLHALGHLTNVTYNNQNYTMSYQTNSKNGFAMMYLPFHNLSNNWYRYDLNKTKLHLKLTSLKNSLMQLEIKSNNSCFSKEYQVTKDTYIILNINEIPKDILENIKEICLTFFNKDNKKENNIQVHKIYLEKY